MQVEELTQFIKWFDDEVRGQNIVKLYQQLFKILNQNIQPGQPKQSFESQRNALLEGIMKVNLVNLNDTQLRFAEHIGLLNLVGSRAKESIEDILFKNAIDIATASQKIKEFENSLNIILQKLSQVSEGLSQYIEITDSEYKEALVHIRFQHEASINNIVDLKKWSNAWYDIGRGIALANKLPPEDVKIIGASRGSIIYDLSVAYLIANMLTGIILLVLKVADRVLELRKKAEELRGMRLSNDKAAQELLLEAEKVEKEGQSDVLKSIKAGKKFDGEQETALSNAIDRLFDFIIGGGEIDVHLEEKESNDENISGEKKQERIRMISEIKQSFKEIKRLESKILLLKDKNN